ncbi:uncharacterized protein SOCE836_088580 [Sorangium cellulosum]|uniref:Uncharacterized protein n=1 Tax=Sorangium cellulosum TaxID=56 RepID=A0A4P2R156_SORCE|nr:uncharacterized protein SOCE836_088580 [Sorangium cellulosum]
MDGQRWRRREAQPGWGQPGSGAAQPGSGAAQPGSGAAQPGSGAAQPGSGAAQPGSGAAQPGSGAAQPGSGQLNLGREPLSSTRVGCQVQGGCNKSRLRHHNRHDSVAMDVSLKFQEGSRRMASVNFALGRPAGPRLARGHVPGHRCARPSSASVTPATAAASDPGASLDAVVVSLRRGRDAWARGGDGWVGYLRGYAVALPPSELRGVAHRPAHVRRWPAAHPRWPERCRGARRTVGRAAVEAARLGSTPMTTRSLGPGARCAAAHAGQQRALRTWREGQA